MGGTVAQLVELLLYHAWDPCSILTMGAVCLIVLVTAWVFSGYSGFHQHPKGVQVGGLMELCKLPLLCREWMWKWDNRTSEQVIERQRGPGGPKGLYPCCIFQSIYHVSCWMAIWLTPQLGRGGTIINSSEITPNCERKQKLLQTLLSRAVKRRSRLG